MNLRCNLGLDYDLDALRLARELNPQGGQILYVCASAEAVPLPESSVDHVVCRATLLYAKVEGVLAETGRIIRPGGTAAFSVVPWTYFLRWFLPYPRSLKLAIAGFLTFLFGLWFNLIGQQIRIRLGHLRVTETFQTEFRMRRLFKRYGLTVYRVVRDPEFIFYVRSTN